MKAAIAFHKICGDGAYTKKCSAWLEERLGAKKALLHQRLHGARYGLATALLLLGTEVENAGPIVCDAEYRLSGRDLSVRLIPDPALKDPLRYAFYLYRDGQIQERTGYFDRPEKRYPALLPGRYHVKYFVRSGDRKQSFPMDEIEIV